MKSKHEASRSKHRQISVFLFFPKTLIDSQTGTHQTRWMERATIKQIYFQESGVGWADDSWVD